MVTRKFGIAAVAGLALSLFAGLAQAQSKQVVVYSANDNDVNSFVFEAFAKETGIQVQPVAAGSGVLVKRIATEKDRPQGDVVWGISRSLLQTNAQYFTPYRSKHADAVPAEYRDPNDLWIGNNLHLMVILQNTKLLPEAQGPKSWADLLDPKWKGKIAFTDPANSGSAYTTTTMLVQLWGGGDQGWKKVTEFYKQVKPLNKSSLVFQGVGNGEYPLGVSLENPGYLWASNGAPVKVIYPSEGTTTQMEGTAIIKGGPNTENAKEFVDFVNSKEMREKILAKLFRRPARQDIDLAKFAPGMPKLSEVKLVPYDEAAWTAQRAEGMAKIRDIIESTR